MTRAFRTLPFALLTLAAIPAGAGAQDSKPVPASAGDQGLTSTQADRDAALQKALEENKALAAGTHPVVIPDLQKVWAKQDDDDLAGKNGAWVRLKTAFRLGRWGVLFKTALPYLGAALIGAVLALGFATRRAK